MTVATSASTLNTIDELVLQGYRRAGLVPIDFDIGGDVNWNTKAAHGRLTLNRLINELALQGFIDHFVTFYVHDLVSGDPQYTISSSENILNFVDQASYIPASNLTEEVETEGETSVKPMSRHRWNELSAKAAIGTPALYYIDRNGSDLTLYVWPVPSEAGKIRFQVHRLPGSNSTGTNNADLLRHWDGWMVNALAYEFMTDAKLPIPERDIVRQDRDRQLSLLKAYETSNEPPDVIMCHSTPWSSYGY